MKIRKTRPPQKLPQKNRAWTDEILANVSSSGRIPGKWEWHCKTLLNLREHLLSDRREQLQDVAKELEPQSMHAADSATDQFDHDLSLSELSQRQNALFEIDEALKRILNGTYGRCEETGAPIPGARLRAIPWARFSKEVEARLERKDILRRPGLGLLHSLRKSHAVRLSPTPEELESREAELDHPRALIEKAVSEPPKVHKNENGDNEE